MASMSTGRTGVSLAAQARTAPLASTISSLTGDVGEQGIKLQCSRSFPREVLQLCGRREDYPKMVGADIFGTSDGQPFIFLFNENSKKL